MALSATRLVLATLLLGSSAISAHAGWFDFTSSNVTAKEEKKPATSAGPSTNLEDSIRQAQMLRLAGNYTDAVKHLSQLMMVASDDPRVVSEYGKSLAAMGRAQDAVSFLTRAEQLQPSDWTNYSALGVAYDQLGNQKDAQAAYEHALALKPGEPIVLNNYALSRMLANDPAMARNLAARAEIANASANDPKIAANIAMIRSMAPDATYAVNTPAPSAMPHMASPQAAPRVPVASSRMAQSPPFVQLPSPPIASNGAPRPLMAPADNSMIDAAPPMAQMTPDPNRVVMQRVPVDPLAGPVMGPATTAAKVLPSAPVKAAAAPAPAATKTATAPAPKVLPPAPAKTAAKPKDTIPGLRMSANAY
jgi:Flp pilus assembly protein TadD